MLRRPIVAGKFYPGGRDALEAAVRGYLATAPRHDAVRAIVTMVPHAGYFYSGAVAGMTLGWADLPDRLVLLGPNHTGRGAPLAVWDAGSWETPLGRTDVDEPLAVALLDRDRRFTADREAHLGEHSIEVVIPFLQAKKPLARILPIAVAEPRLDVLISAAESLAEVIRAQSSAQSTETPVAMIVSSDMSHYLPDAETREQDALALKAILALDPEGLYATVRTHGISMCGVLPMTLALATARRLGASHAELASYATSGEASGEYDRVVGYAGALVS